MSRKHPIIAVTGSSGAGTSTVKDALKHIFERVWARAGMIEGVRHGTDPDPTRNRLIEKAGARGNGASLGEELVCLACALVAKDCGTEAAFSPD